MKKIFFLMIALLIVGIIMCSCSGGNKLDIDDFFVYNSDSDNRMIEDILNELPYAPAINFSVGKNLQTKRGIRIGSTVQEVADAYNGITCNISSLPDSVTTYEPTYLTETTIDKFITDQPIHMNSRYEILYHSFIDGAYFSNAVPDGYDYKEVAKAQVYFIKIIIIDNLVSDITAYRVFNDNPFDIEGSIVGTWRSNIYNYNLNDLLYDFSENGTVSQYMVNKDGSLNLIVEKEYSINKNIIEMSNGEGWRPDILFVEGDVLKTNNGEDRFIRFKE